MPQKDGTVCQADVPKEMLDGYIAEFFSAALVDVQLGEIMPYPGKDLLQNAGQLTVAQLHALPDKGKSILVGGAVDSASDVAFATHMAGESAKYRELKKLFNRNQFQLGNKLLIITRSDWTTWSIGLYLEACGIRIKCLIPGMSPAERAQVCATFDDPTSEIQALVSPPSRIDHGLNMQHACRTVIFMEVLETTDQYREVMGHIHRLGQRFQQSTICMYVHDSFDSALQAHVFGNTTLEALMKEWKLA